MTDFATMDGPTLLEYCRDDAAKWAAAFCDTAKRLGYGDIDEGWMIGWFANAIEHSHAVRTRDVASRYCRTEARSLLLR